MGSNNQLVGMLLLGIAIGTYIPAFPEPIQIINPYIGIILLVIAVILFVKS
ncbi:MAG: hypothetical protein JW744_05505 [Candidatus Diapherotrites archaeon]|uniref:Uncharacterized protein n=1 Tax=Candidatus Iainarchaeum sp. TaxID=3101447 RepID=A0A938YXC9_9ARCH|nr:hypothetical protein [Candidatus Diapherotrites archaeon]